MPGAVLAGVLFAPLLVLAIGVVLGTLGGGGSALTLPLLTEQFGLDAPHAAATSLVIVCLTALVGVIPHARAGRVDARTGLLFGGSGLLGGLVGGRIGVALPPGLLLGGFCTLMLVTAALMLRRPRLAAAPAGSHPAATWAALVTGFGVGGLAAVLGAGGGFLVVPALTLVGGLPVEAAIGTSLLVIALNTGGGALGYLSALDLDLGLALRVTGVMVVGVVLGGRLTGRLPAPALRRGFACLLVAATALLLWRRLPELATLS